MNPDTKLLDHAVTLFPAPEPPFDRLIKRRNRKHRNKRIAAAIVALVVAVAGIGGALEIFRHAVHEEPGRSQVRWIHQFLEEGHDGRSPIAADDSGVYVLTDTIDHGPDRHSQVRLTRYDFSGNTVWSRTFGYESKMDDGAAIELQGGSIFVAAKTHTFGSFTIARYERDGTQAWVRSISNPGRSRGIDLAVAPDGLYITITAEGKTDDLLRKYDLDGNEIWSQNFPPYIKAVTADQTGAYVTFDSYTAPGKTDAVLRKFDPSGRALWTVSIERPSDDLFTDVTAAGGGVYAVGRAGAPLEGQSTGGIFVQRYTDGGDLLWTRQFGERAGFGILYPGGGAWSDRTGVYVGGFDRDGPFVKAFDPDGDLRWTKRVTPSRVTGEANLEVAVWEGATFVSWEQGLHASPTETDWTGYIESIGGSAKPPPSSLTPESTSASVSTANAIPTTAVGSWVSLLIVAAVALCLAWWRRRA